MKIIHVCTEFFPLIKTGGLADVTGALPLAQRQNGLDVRILMPGFPALMDNIADLKFIARCDTFAGQIRLLLGHYQELPVYLIDAPKLYHRPGSPYSDANRIDYPDNHLRFALLSWIGCQLAKGLDPQWRPELVHGHDWHAGLTGAYLAQNHYPARSLFTVHNLAYQGLFPADYLETLQLPEHAYHQQGLEFYGQISYIKSGLFYADHITTVSPTYAMEICQSDFGQGLDGLLQEKRQQGKLSGILNGIDYNVWDPATDKHIAFNYHSKNLANKRRNKAELQSESNLDIDEKALLFACVSRITSQKGLDLLLAALPHLFAQKGQFVLLGSGDLEMEKAFSSLAERYPGQMKITLGYDDPLSHRIMAGADVIMVPSRFEPCGLTQLYALKYGALPLVRATGGLADTVSDCTLENMADDTASGFVFQHSTIEDLDKAIRRAFALWRQPKIWQKMQRRNMLQQLDWQKAAMQYSDLYQHMLDNK